MRPFSSVLAVAVAAAVAGCSSNPAAPVAPELVAGYWGVGFTVPGNSFSMMLVTSGTDVTGTARGCGEAGPCTASAITGTSDESGVHLTFVTSITVPQQSGPFTSTFDGKLVNANTLRGTLVTVGDPYVASDPVGITYQRESAELR